MGQVASPVSVTKTNCHHGGKVKIPVPEQVLKDFDKKYSNLASLHCDRYLTTLAGEKLKPGTYCFDQASTNTGGVLTLVGDAEYPNKGWVFKIDVGAFTATDFVVKMSDGGDACNVDWRVAAAATITRGDFIGNIYAGSAITVTGAAPTSPFRGRALARAWVTLTNSHFNGCVSKPQNTAVADTPLVCEIEEENDVVYVKYGTQSSYGEGEDFAAITLDRKSWYIYDYYYEDFIGPFTEGTRGASIVTMADDLVRLSIDLKSEKVTECYTQETKSECDTHKLLDSQVSQDLDIVQMLVGHIFRANGEE
jgi:hypothetical protein